MEIFDTHAHYDDEKFDNDRDKVLKSLKQENVTRCINVGCDIETSIKTCELAKEYDFLYAIIGIHPSEIEETMEQNLNQIEEIKKLVQANTKVVGIGEIGLDYHWQKDNKEMQKEIFIKQIELANELKLPVSIHTRDAIDDTINIIKNVIKIEHGGVLHCCPFNKELVRHGLDAGLYIAFGGTSTFKNSKNSEEIIKMVPNNRMLIETDSPYLAPEPLRGTRNDSRNLKYVINRIAEVKKMSAEDIADITFNNALDLFASIIQRRI